MKKILLAIGHRKLEEYLKSQLSNEFSFVGTTVYREGIINAITQKKPDIVIVRETLSGVKNIMGIVYKIRSNFPDIRIIFLAGNRKIGDELLANLVNYGVYDILSGENIPVQEIISLIKKPNSYDNVKHLQPVPLFDEEKNKILFEPPESIEKKIEIVKVINKTEKSNKKEKKNENKKEKNNKKKDKDINESIEVKKTKDKDNNIQKKEGDSKQRRGLLDRIRFPKAIKRQKEKAKKLIPIVDTNNIIGEKIITFIGGKSGVGTTTLAVNTSFVLASKGYKVVFIELNAKHPSVNYWYELGFMSEGIETCINAVSKKEYREASKAIVKSSMLTEKETIMKKNYKQFPDTLDFMFYSKEFLFKLKEDRKIKNPKELLLYLVYQLNYDFVIVDFSSDMKDEIVQDGIIFSDKIFSVITQDVSSIGYCLFNIDDFRNININIDLKNNFILNKYVESDFTKKDIKNWIEVDKLLVVPYFKNDFINANFKGLPAVVNNKNLELLNSIHNIVNVILEK